MTTIGCPSDTQVRQKNQNTCLYKYKNMKSFRDNLLAFIYPFPNLINDIFCL
ncbi:hypothetical protein GLOIN_2v1659114, partial [Rhizophagus irregularis DAOM 181602=DAOM 197198]